MPKTKATYDWNKATDKQRRRFLRNCHRLEASIKMLQNLFDDQILHGQDCGIGMTIEKLDTALNKLRTLPIEKF